VTEPDPFRPISLEDITMPGGWSVSSGQTHLYTAEERRLMLQARAFAQKELLPRSAELHRRVKEIKATHEAGSIRHARLREIAQAYLAQLDQAGLTGALYPEVYGGNGRGVVAECIVDEELAAAGHPA
jgi:alkylation response protein AidB-like acyl-CoA dehydrogenase